MPNSIVVLLLFHHLSSLGKIINKFYYSIFLLRIKLFIYFRFYNHVELRQSTKHLKKYDRNNYKLEVKRCNSDDKGEYIVRASNSYGEKEYSVFLTVECKYHDKITWLITSPFNRCRPSVFIYKLVNICCIYVYSEKKRNFDKSILLFGIINRIGFLCGNIIFSSSLSLC